MLANEDQRRIDCTQCQHFEPRPKLSDYRLCGTRHSGQQRIKWHHNEMQVSIKECADFLPAKRAWEPEGPAKAELDDIRIPVPPG